MKKNVNKDSAKLSRKQQIIQRLDTQIQIDGRLRQAQLRMAQMLACVDEICTKYGLDYWLDRGTLLGAVRHQGFVPWDDDLDIAMPRASYEQFIQIAPQVLPSNLCIQTRHNDPGYFNMAAPLKIRDKNSYFLEKHEEGTESYQQGIFIDVFPYDYAFQSQKVQRFYKWLSKKILRLLAGKYSNLKMGYYSGFYRYLGKLFSKNFLECCLNKIIIKANSNPQKANALSYGYDSTKKMVFFTQDIYPIKRIIFEGYAVNSVAQPEKMLTQIYGDYLTLPPIERQRPNHCRFLRVECT